MAGSRHARLEAEAAAFDAWVSGLGGYTGARYAALRAEALEFAGADGCMAYLEMCQAVDAEHAAGAGRWLAAEAELANAREARRQAGHAAAAALRRSAEIKLAAEQLLADPRLAEPDFSTRASMTGAEVALEARAMLGLARRAPSAWEAMLPAVGDLAHVIGVKR